MYTPIMLMQCSEFLLKKLYAYRIINTEGFENIRDNNNQKDEDLALKIASQQIKAMSDIEKMSFGPEATIAVIAEHYGMMKRSGDRDIKSIFNELDSYRPIKISSFLNEPEFNLRSYIFKTLESENKTVFDNYDKNMLAKQIKIAEEFQFDHDERMKASIFETKGM